MQRGESPFLRMEIRRTLRIREEDPLLTTLSENVDTYGTGEKEWYCRELFAWGIGRLAERMGSKRIKHVKRTQNARKRTRAFLFSIERIESVFSNFHCGYFGVMIY